MTCLDKSLVLKGELAERLKVQGLPMAKECLVVSIDQQKLWHFNQNNCAEYIISTARAGKGCVQDSLQTPTGLHRIAEKIGSDAPVGMIFKARKPTGEIWNNRPTTEDNLITSRIFWLQGCENGLNQGLDSSGKVVDTKERYIYIHGTNQHEKLGTPNSHGCVLLSDKDIIKLFESVDVGTYVYLS
jgi:lipoprotein-anchoring transpeptidase ErfK/SrfK